MTVVETYFTMNARIVAILRQSSDPMALYAAQRIEELERIAGIRGECLEMAVKTLEWYTSIGVNLVARQTVSDIRAQLATLEQENIPNSEES